ncbi:hypothetical protein BAJUN_00930 [Bajunvirus bajun]|uniref:Uncharacterized protein n=1 Tax=Brevundimonas phage vB_BgoS-Bajun TaxID=2948594 RepID=A0A9E7N4H1_9CAUD|nr:hypothetical protein BAJUN_00930 [Brevundimonas phage vB_BgoS-Bajun]
MTDQAELQTTRIDLLQGLRVALKPLNERETLAGKGLAIAVFRGLHAAQSAVTQERRVEEAQGIFAGLKLALEFTPIRPGETEKMTLLLEVAALVHDVLVTGSPKYVTAQKARYVGLVLRLQAIAA